MNKSAPNYHIRWMIRRDIPSVVAIEAGSFSDPWTEEEFVRCLRQRNCIGMVVVDRDDEVVGFMVYELHKNYLHLINLAVDPNCRFQQYGTALVGKMKSKLHPDRRNRITLEIRETNLEGQLFFRSQGFMASRVLRDYYENSMEDAYSMIFRCQWADAMSQILGEANKAG